MSETPEAPAMPKLWTGTELAGHFFPEPKWAIPNLICEGVTLLAGPPKVGKSWLSLAWALDVAEGRPVFGEPVTPGPVLYLALEDTPRRLQHRMKKVLGGDAAPAMLQIATEWRTMPDLGAEFLARWCKEHLDGRLIVIDVFAKVRGPVPHGMSAYDADYAAIGHIKKIADHFGIAVILVHHVRKASNDDFLQEVSGTNGIAGSADAVLVLRRSRGSADGLLHITGRDIAEAEKAMQLDEQTGRWNALDGPVQAYQMGDTRAAITRWLNENQAGTPAQIAEALGLDPALVRQTLSRMFKANQLTTAQGFYTLPA